MADETKPPKPYAIGYGRPPVYSRFVKGKSGNPTGKRRRPESFEDRVARVLDEKVEIGEGGRRKRATKLTVIAKQLVNRAASGDPGWFKVLLKVLPGLRASAIPDQNADRKRSEQEQREANEALERLSPIELRQFIALVRKARGYRVSFYEEDEPEETPAIDISNDADDDTDCEVTGMRPQSGITKK